MRVGIACLALCSVGFGCALFAQEEVQSDVAKLDALTRRMVSHLESLPGYRVDVTQKWTLDGKEKAEGTNRVSLSARHSGEFRLEVKADSEKQTSLICTGDGRRITRQIRSGDSAVHSEHEGGLEELQQDAMTETSLRHSGLDLLCRPDPEQHLMVMASQIRYLGQKDLPAGPAHHFRMTWGGQDSHECEIWIAGGDTPLLLKTLTTLKLDPHPDLEHELSVTTDLTWQKMDEHPRGLFHPNLPEGSLKVADLHSHLIEGQSARLLGKPAPSISLPSLDGSSWSLPDDKAVILYFFATWAFPSHFEKESLLKLLSDYEPKDIVVAAISVGEKKAAVHEFANAQKYRHSILLDSEQKVAQAYGVSSVPTVVLIGRNGKVQTVHVGNTPEVRDTLRREIEQVLEGKTLQQ